MRQMGYVQRDTYGKWSCRRCNCDGNAGGVSANRRVMRAVLVLETRPRSEGGQRGGGMCPWPKNEKNITVKDRFIHLLRFVSCYVCWKCQYWKICQIKLCHRCFKVTFKKTYHYGPIQIRRHIPNSKPSSHKFQTEEILYDIAKGYLKKKKKSGMGGGRGICSSPRQDLGGIPGT